MLKLEKSERLLSSFVMVLLALAIFGPPMSQPPLQHSFADQRSLAHIPFAMNVLSNLPFALWGALGLGCVGVLVRRHNSRMDVLQGLACVLFAGLILTAAASAWYHWQPDDARLAVDRLGMVVAFAAMLGLAAADRVTARAGSALAQVVLMLGTLGVAIWFLTGNVLPWVVLQLGGMALLLWLSRVQALPGALAVRWNVVVMIYAAAKLFELADHEVYALSSHVISGHSLKHVVASCAGWPLLAALTDSHKRGAESASPSVAEQSALAGRKSPGDSS